MRVPDNTPRPRSLDRGEGIVQPVSEEADQLSRRLHHPAPGRKAGGFLTARGVAPHLTPRTEFDLAFRTARPLAQDLPRVIWKNRSPGLRVSRQKPETQHSGRVIALAALIGFDAIDLGDLQSARYLEPLAMRWIHLAIPLGYGRNFAFAILRRP